MVRIIPYYLVRVLFGTAIPTSFLNLFNWFFILVCVHFYSYHWYAIQCIYVSAALKFVTKQLECLRMRNKALVGLSTVDFQVLARLRMGNGLAHAQCSNSNNGFGRKLWLLHVVQRFAGWLTNIVLRMRENWNFKPGSVWANVTQCSKSTGNRAHVWN